MAASLSEPMPVPAAMELRLGSKPATSLTSGRLLKPPAQSEVASTTKTSEAVSSSGSPRRTGPARKKLTTLEAQRVMGVLATAIRRVELAAVLPQLAAQRREDLDVGFGVELTRRLEEHGVLLGSLDELREAGVKRRESRASSAVNSVRSDQPCESSAITLEEHQTPVNGDVTSTANTPPANDRVTSQITTRSTTCLNISQGSVATRFSTCGGSFAIRESVPLKQMESMEMVNKW